MKLLIESTTTVELVKYNSYVEMAMDIVEPTIVTIANLKAHSMRWERDDLAQELRLHIWERLVKYNPNIATINNWCWIVCRNKIIQLIRKDKRLKRKSEYTKISLEEANLN